MLTDPELLRRYAVEKSDAAFEELVRRHISLVYAVARRQVGGDTHLAEDVTQQVFTALARKATMLSDRATLSGWLYRSAHFAASDAVRAERRRRVREQEAHTMQETTSAEPGEADWEKLRPTLDALIAQLDDADRDAVSLRFFDGCSFAQIGAHLRLSENAARMRVDRALDKLQSALTRRGVTSTTAALGLVLTSQAAAVVPVSLAASVAGAAVTGAATATGVVAWLGGGKIVAAVAGAVAFLTAGVAIVEHQRARDAERALVVIEQQQGVTAARLAELSVRTERAELRATEAEKDNESLLKAVDAFKAQQTTPARSTGAAPRAPAEEDEALTYARAYQQGLARQRAQEAIARANVDDSTSRLDDASAYHRLINLARHLRDEASFQEAIRTFNKAMAVKPAELAVTDEIRQLQTELQAQNTPVPVTLISDGQTWVSITNARQPEKFTSVTVKLLPGNYQIVGRRKSFRDVEIPLVVRSGMSIAPITVICTVTFDSR
jgi:RNA polymerase sigma factor (sigma-70 family)